MCRRHPVCQNTVAVFPFAYRGSEELSYLGEGVAALLSAEVDAAGDLISIEPDEYIYYERSESR